MDIEIFGTMLLKSDISVRKILNANIAPALAGEFDNINSIART